jgi:hypothetical protein
LRSFVRKVTELQRLQLPDHRTGTFSSKKTKKPIDSTSEQVYDQFHRRKLAGGKQGKTATRNAPPNEGKANEESN